jgi:hypothetical protein
MTSNYTHTARFNAPQKFLVPDEQATAGRAAYFDQRRGATNHANLL